MSSVPSLSLDGAWSFTTDPQERGESEAWYDRSSGFGRPVFVPSPWQLYGRDLLDYTGSGWYHREFEVPEDWSGRCVRLIVGASDYLTRVWINGELVGQHEGGYTPFAFEINGPLRLGEVNNIVIRVYDPRDHSEIPHGQQGSSFTRVSGIWQSIGLEARQPTYVKQLGCRPGLNPDRVDLTVTLNQLADGLPLRAAIFDPTGKEVAFQIHSISDDTITLRLEIPECRRWSPDDPFLYTLRVVLGEGDDGDEESRAIGIREVMAIDGRLFLNGQPLMLRGAVDHGYWPGTLYMPPADEEIQRELRLAKEAGLNVLRKHGKVEDPRYLDWCDRLGMLVWAEVPYCGRWTPQARSRFRADMLAMIQRDLHRPSIIAWTLYHAGKGLEEAGDELQPWLRAIHDEVYAIDPSRPQCTHAGGTAMRTDLIDEHHRYVLPEESRQWHTSLMGDVPAAGAPRLVSEFGLWGLPATHGPGIPDPSERWWLGGIGPGAVAAHGEESKWPRTAEINFERFKLAAVFEDLDNLAKLTQRRLTRGIKGLVEQLRRRPAFAGYIGRSFTDSEWEASGWLDYDRQPKLGFDEWSTFNGPIAILADLPRRNFWSGEQVDVSFYVSNHSRNAVKGVLQWGIDGADCDGEVEVDVPPFQTIHVGQAQFCAPEFPRSQATRLVLRLHSGGWEINNNSEELTITPNEAGTVQSRRVTLRHVTGDLGARLAAQGFEVLEDWSPGIPLLTGSLEPDVMVALDAGANVVFLAEYGAKTPCAGFLSFRELPHASTWERSASIHYIQWDLFPHLPLNTIMGWEMEDLYPHHVIPLGSYGQGSRRVTSNQAEEDPANILAGYFEGWLGHFSASMLLSSLRRGHLLTTTLRLNPHYGRHPIATLLLNRLLTESHLFEPRTVYQLET